MADSGADSIARFFDREACCSGAAPRANGRLRGAPGILLRLLDEVGLTGRSVLDAGCGQGDLALALARKGADVSGIDLSPESVAVAQRAARDTGVTVQVAVGDAAVDLLEAHDVVVLNRVVCCYFDPAELLANTVPCAREVFAISVPHSRGPRGLMARLVVGIENGWRRLRGDPFRAFVHDFAIITRTLRSSGLRPMVERSHWTWHVAVYERHGSAADEDVPAT